MPNCREAAFAFMPSSVMASRPGGEHRLTKCRCGASPPPLGHCSRPHECHGLRCCRRFLNSPSPHPILGSLDVRLAVTCDVASASSVHRHASQEYFPHRQARGAARTSVDWQGGAGATSTTQELIEITTLALSLRGISIAIPSRSSIAHATYSAPCTFPCTHINVHVSLRKASLQSQEA